MSCFPPTRFRPGGRRAGVPGRGLVPAAVACTAALAALAAWGALLQHRLADGTAPAALVLDDAAAVLVGLLLATAGLLILAHRSGRVTGWLLLATALGLITARAAVAAVAAHPGHPAAVTAALVVWIAGTALHTTMIGVLPLLFPAGRLPWRGLRWYVAAVAVWAVLQAYLPVAREREQFGVANPVGRGAAGEAARYLYAVLEEPVEWSAVVLLTVALTVMVPWWRRAEGPPRWQTIAFIVPFAVWVVTLMIAYSLRLMGWPRLVLLGGGAVLWAAALGYAFTRDRIWAIDRPTRHLLTGFVLVTGVLLAYGGAIAAVTAANRDARGLGAVLPACLTFAVGVALRPTARRCARVVDRLYYGERSRPYQLARDLAERLSRTVRPQDAPSLLCTTAVDSLRLPSARLVVPARNGPRELAVAGDLSEHGPEEDFDLAYDGAVIGHLRVRPRDGAAALDGQDRDVLRFLADQAAPAVASLRLYEDLRASREGLVTAREAERWRLRRDIHDGIGPALSALRLRIDTVAAAVPDGTPESAALSEVSGDVARLIDDVRRVSAGLVPGALTEVGLGAAVRGLADRVRGAVRIDVRLSPDPLPEVPAATEAAAYRIAAEALTNVVRHARARRALVALSADAAGVRVEVRDDGAGMPPCPARTGVGLQSMAESATELGGKFAISSDAEGTVVRAVLPMAASDGSGRPES